MAALDVVELPPPTPSSCNASPEPNAEASRPSKSPSRCTTGSTSTALNNQHLLVPPRIQVLRSVTTSPAFLDISQFQFESVSWVTWPAEPRLHHSSLEYNYGNVDDY